MKAKGLTAEKAYETALENHFSVEVGDHHFAMLGYIKEDGSVEGPMMITLERGVAIEVDREYKFKNAYTAKLDRFVPWMTIGEVYGSEKSVRRSNELAKIVVGMLEEKISKLEQEIKTLKEKR